MTTIRTIHRVLRIDADGTESCVGYFDHALSARECIRDAWLSENASCAAWNADIVESIVVPAIMRLGVDTASRADHPMPGNDSAWRIRSTRVIGAYAGAHDRLVDRALELNAESVHIGWTSSGALPEVRAYMHAEEGSARRYVRIVAGKWHAEHNMPTIESWFDSAGDPMPAPIDAQVSA